MTGAAARDFVDRIAAGRRAQGLPPKIENPAVLAEIAAIVRGAEGGGQRAVT